LLRDRGNIKWQGMFLPEHVKLLRQHQGELDKRERPALDEQQLELMEETIREAMEFNQALNFVYFRGGNYHLLVGKVHFADPFKQELRIVDNFEEISIIKIRDLIDVKMN
jgi:YolD-like protein